MLLLLVARDVAELTKTSLPSARDVAKLTKTSLPNAGTAAELIARTADVVP